MATGHHHGRETFSSGLAVFFATLGSAVGLGNIWKFPYLTGKFGGGAFLLVYLLCVLLIGLPIMLGEFYIGRRTRRNVVGAFNQLAPGTPWRGIGAMGVSAAYLIMFFYSCVAGWVYYYLFRSLRGDFTAVTPDLLKSEFGAIVTGVWTPIFWQWVVLLVVTGILIMGVKKGIERITKTLMPVLFLLILACDIRALTLPGAGEGVNFLLHVDFSQLTPTAILTAMGLAFFKLSLGMGTMTTYASYFTASNNMMATAVKVAAADTLVSILAGLAIFPTVFAFGMEPGAGPGLLFMTIPLVFSQMPFGQQLLIAFFFLTSIAATTAMLSIVEVLIAYFSEEHGVSRRKAAIGNALLIALVGMLAAWSADPGGPLGQVVFGGRGFFDWFDYLSSNILLPVGGLFIVLFLGYAANKQDIIDQLTNSGSLSLGRSTLPVFFFLARFVTPALLAIIFLNAIGLLKV